MSDATQCDLVIRGATIVDGSGRSRFEADLGIRDTRIVEIGSVGARGSKEIDGRGRVLAPGFIDIHTHYDAQLCWDGLATPSLLHGVTTVCIGNCSLSVAPVRADDARRIVGMFQTIEDVPESTFDAGVPWTWESVSEYLDCIEGQLAINVTALVGHSTLRLYAMGAASQERTATDEEISAMASILRDAVAAGARGFSTSYLDVDENLKPVPSRYADLREKIALAQAVGEAGGAVLGAVPNAGSVEEMELCIRELGEISRASGLLCTLQPIVLIPTVPDLWKRSLDWISEEVAQGAQIYGQSPPGPMNFNLRLDETFFPFFLLPTWGDIMHHPIAERAARLADPALRSALTREGEDGLALFLPNAWIGETYSQANEGLSGRRLFDVAAERGQSPVETLIEIALEDALHTEFNVRAAMHGSEEIAHEIIRHPQMLVGASDAGAHLSQFCGAGDTSYFLAEYVRKRDVFSLEEAVHRITGQPAELFGIADRGRIEIGGIADLVLFDPDRIEAGPERFVRDLPGDATRYIREALGVHSVLVGGEVVVDEGSYTSARPGRII
ncbi:MAG: amidohydrolase family protein [Deltaproteobacteria bacterium]|nr:amidohydrolase family protein [Deltaproteobacteria bacterium]MBW2362639.1 amidohydrolase family protein [Deltaproteobacteria bacterium]